MVAIIVMSLAVFCLASSTAGVSRPISGEGDRGRPLACRAVECAGLHQAREWQREQLRGERAMARDSGHPGGQGEREGHGRRPADIMDPNLRYAVAVPGESVKPALVGSARRGFTLVELLVSLVVVGIVMGAMIGVLARQQRFYKSATDLMDTRGRIRQALAVLPSDLRALSPSDTLSGGANTGDVYLWNDHALEFRSVAGSSVVCWLPAVTPVTTLRLPPVGLLNALTAWQATPVVGDSLLVFDNTAIRWRVYAITAIAPVSGAAGCPTGAGQFLTAAQGALSSYSVTVSPALSAT